MSRTIRFKPTTVKSTKHKSCTPYKRQKYHYAEEERDY